MLGAQLLNFNALQEVEGAGVVDLRLPILLLPANEHAFSLSLFHHMRLVVCVDEACRGFLVQDPLTNALCKVLSRRELASVLITRAEASKELDGALLGMRCADYRLM